MIRRMMFAAAALIPVAFLTKSAVARQAGGSINIEVRNVDGGIKLFDAKGREIKLRIVERVLTNASAKPVSFTIIGTHIGDVTLELPPMSTYHNEGHEGEPDPELHIRVNTEGAALVRTERWSTGRLWTSICVGPGWKA